jgi:CCR4-NOT transcriptional regulation complex NOT5 subunit
VNQKLLAMLSEAEQELVRETEPVRLAELDEDELLELHTRVRRARTKYTKLYRRRAGDQVRAESSRGRASAANARTRQKAEIFEDVLATVSRRLAVVAKQSAADLKAERLAAARGQGVPTGTGPGSTKASSSARKPTAKRGGDDSLRSPISKKATASTRATGKRRQAERDSR